MKDLDISHKLHTFAPVKQKGHGRVAQLNRVADYGSAGYRFESCRGHEKAPSYWQVLFSFFYFCIEGFRCSVCGTLLKEVNEIPICPPRHTIWQALSIGVLMYPNKESQTPSNNNQFFLQPNFTMGDRLIFIIKHNTDYIHFSFIRKRNYVLSKTHLRFT